MSLLRGRYYYGFSWLIIQWVVVLLPEDLVSMFTKLLVDGFILWEGLSLLFLYVCVFSVYDPHGVHSLSVGVSDCRLGVVSGAYC